VHEDPMHDPQAALSSPKASVTSRALSAMNARGRHTGPWTPATASPRSARPHSSGWRTPAVPASAGFIDLADRDPAAPKHAGSWGRTRLIMQAPADEAMTESACGSERSR